MRNPTLKTLRDTFRAMMADRKALNAINERATGIVEAIGPADQLRDDFLLETKDADEERRCQQSEREAQD